MLSQNDAEKLERRNRELAILNAIAQALNREADVQRALETALAQVAELLGLRTGWIWLLREGSGEPYLAASQNLPPGLARDPHSMAGRCYCLDTFQAGDLDGAANVNVITCSRLRLLLAGTEGLRYHASIPLYAQARKLGVLNVASADWRELSPDDLQLLYTAGDVISMAIQRARLFDESAHFGAVEERNRLAREIHDTLAQGLAGIALQLETAEALMEAEGTERPARRAVGQALALARANLEEARRSVHDLRAAPLEGRTLGEALARLVEEWRAKGSPEITFATGPGGDHGSAPGGGGLPIRVETGVYRIAQEALANAVRHGNARHITLTLKIEGGQVRLSVADDGQGFDTRQAFEGRYGLTGLRERAKLLGGRLRVRSVPGHGTRVDAAIPYEARS